MHLIAAAARETRTISEVVVSTDDDDVASVARAAGLDVPFRRPAFLATDEANTVDVIRHALGTLDPDAMIYDSVMLLQPTCPFRPPSLLDHCMTTFRSATVETVMTVVAIPDHFHPAWALYAAPGADVLHLESFVDSPPTRRQSLPAAYARHGGVYITSRSAIESGVVISRSAVGVEIVGEHFSLNIDTMDDFRRAESMLTPDFYSRIPWLQG